MTLRASSPRPLRAPPRSADRFAAQWHRISLRLFSAVYELLQVLYSRLQARCQHPAVHGAGCTPSRRARARTYVRTSVARGLLAAPASVCCLPAGLPTRAMNEAWDEGARGICPLQYRSIVPRYGTWVLKYLVRVQGQTTPVTRTGVQPNLWAPKPLVFRLSLHAGR